MGVTALVLGLHIALLGLWPGGPGQAPGADGPRRLQVRQIAHAARDAAARPAAAGVSLTMPDTGAGGTESAGTGARAGAGAGAAAIVPRMRSKPRPEATSSEQGGSNAAATPPTGTETDTSSGREESSSEPRGSDLPVYATTLPTSLTLRYALTRGTSRGTAELRWMLEGDRYQLALHSEVGGAQALGSASEGSIDANGLAPERHTESRRSRDVRAVNFQRDSARITFSGPRAAYPLLPGAQDRLSWMLQLGAIMEANPALRRAGSEISMFVAGSRGDAQVWIFNVLDSEAVSTALGEVQAAVHVRREPRRPYDTQVEAWLDPARGHLPARIRLTVRPTGEPTDFVLQGLGSPPATASGQLP